MYGSPRMTAELRRRGWQVNHKRIERLMRVHGVVGHRPRKRRSLTKQDADAPPLPDLVGRRFNPDRPDHSWVGDITYIPTDEGWLYLAGMPDLGSRRLVGYAMGEAHDTQLAEAALEQAVTTRGWGRWTARSSTPTAARNTPRSCSERLASGWGNWTSTSTVTSATRANSKRRGRVVESAERSSR